MAIYHCNVSNVGKASGSASAKHQYVTREGKYAFGEGEESDLAHTHSANMPQWAKEDAQAYWKAADEFSRSNAQVCKEVRFALPRELDREQQIELARSYAQRMSQAEGGSHPYTLGIHDDGTNPHAHLQLSASINDGIEREPEQWFKRYNGKTPERGGARRSPEFHDKEFIERARCSWEQEANQALGRAGQEARISRLTLEEQGIERQAQIHVGYRDPARPEIHEARMARNMDIQAGNVRHVEEVAHLERAEKALAEVNRELEAIQAKQISPPSMEELQAQFEQLKQKWEQAAPKPEQRPQVKQTAAPAPKATPKPEQGNQVKAKTDEQNPFKSERKLNAHIKKMDAEIDSGKPVVSQEDMRRTENEFKVFEKQEIEKEAAKLELGKSGIEWCENAHKVYQAINEYQKQEEKMKEHGLCVENTSLSSVKYGAKDSALKKTLALYNVAQCNLRDCAVNLCKSTAKQAVYSYLVTTCPGASIVLKAVEAFGVKAQNLEQAATPARAIKMITRMTR